MRDKILYAISLILFCCISACEPKASEEIPVSGVNYMQSKSDLIAGETMAIAYSGFREGQYPDRGAGANNPSRAEILEDLKILIDNEFTLIRLYDSGENAKTTLEIIREERLPIKVLLGIWLDAELSNHEGCPWLTEPISVERLAGNKIRNSEEIERGIDLATTFSDIIIAINIGNEALVSWTDHMVPVDQVIAYVRDVKSRTSQPVTVAENYAWWIESGLPLANELDFIGVHTYPIWEERDTEDGLEYTAENILGVQQALPGKTIAILEAGWATIASEFGPRASEEKQLRYFTDISSWARDTNTTVFFFEAFDEPWKGDPNDPLGAEKHWGLFYVDRSPKLAMQPR
ncbi:hypothetical protein [Parvularcula sp. IMCC14364]|uniref:hypothetical protein n=1 Tax=Parvularcula sp. IMCC14364 TaxID=3067902 RepID=UPI002741BBC1|nr:hypothetical protein [Parvularcula sp. IMCC14364]